MEKSIWVVYSIIRNVYTFIHNDKDIDIFKKVKYFNFQRGSKFFLQNAKRIYSDIENNYYTIHELAIFLLYNYMIEGKFDLFKVKPKIVKEVMKLFTFKRLQEDLNLIKKIHKKLNFKRGIKEYFEIKEDGTNIAYILTKKGKISPIFFIRNYEKALTDSNKNVIMISKEYEQFRRIAIKIKEILKGGLNDKTEVQD